MSCLSVVIVTHDHREAVRAALPALAAQLDDGDELIVVDNDSSDGTPDAVRELAPDAIVVEAGANLGFAAGCNRGASTASGELLCFLNPDAVPAPGFREAIERRSPTAVAGPPGRAGHRRGRAGGQHPRRGGPLHRHRLGRRRWGAVAASGAGRRGARTVDRRARVRLRRLPGDPARDLRASRAASRRSSSSTTRTSTCRCGCGSRGSGWAWSRPLGSSTTTSSPRGPPSGAAWSATAGRR